MQPTQPVPSSPVAEQVNGPSARNVLFELEHAWGTLVPGGFHDFRSRHATAAALVCHAEPLTPTSPRQDELGVFAIVWKPVDRPTGFAP